MGSNFFQRFVFILAIVITLQLTFCNKKKRKIDKFDSDTWVADQYGCEGDRLVLMDDLLKVKFRLRGMKMGEIEDVLGKPEGIELYKRDQKYYIYYMEPNENCGVEKENPLKLYVRFSAVGIANELTVRTE